MATFAQIAQMQLARRRKRAAHVPVVKPRKLKVTRKQFKRAIKGTNGILIQIADNLNINRNTAARLLARDGWDDVRAVYAAECEAGADEAEKTIHKVIKDGDFAEASKNARWLLARVRAERYGDKSTTVHEGGDKPVRHVHVTVPVEVLAAPVLEKRKLLQQLDVREAEEQRLLEADEVL